MTDMMDSTWEGVDVSMSPTNRVKVLIRCKNCGETFILRGTKDPRGHIDTGFKRCLCDNDQDFDIDTVTS